jgi:hypothetical protein
VTVPARPPEPETAVIVQLFGADWLWMKLSDGEAPDPVIERLKAPPVTT